MNHGLLILLPNSWMFPWTPQPPKEKVFHLSPSHLSISLTLDLAHGLAQLRLLHRLRGGGSIRPGRGRGRCRSETTARADRWK